MKTIMKTKLDESRLFFCCINLLVAALMFYLSKQTPFYSDDIGHAMNVDGTRIVSVKEIFEMANLSYFTWGGRYLSQLLVRYFIVFHRSLYNTLNAIIFVSYACTIHHYVYSKRVSNIFLVIIYCFLWLFTPSFGGSYLWMTGSITYLWFMLPILVIGFIYYGRWKRIISGEESYRSGNLVIRLFKCLGLFFLGVIAGWSIEAASSTLLFALSVFLLILKRKKYRIDIEYVCGWLGVLIGWCLLILAPGNFARAGVVNESANILKRYIFRIGRETFYSLSYLTIPFGIAVAMLLYLNTISIMGLKDTGRSHGSNMPWRLENTREPFFFVLLALISIYVMTFSAAFANRIFITPIALLLIAIGLLCKKWLDSGEENVPDISARRKALGVMCFFIGVYCLVQVCTAILTCSVHSIPIEKYIDYHYGEAERGVIN